MRRLRRASMIAVSLLAYAATVSAECAWVLWQQQAEILPSGATRNWTWITAEATSTEAECRRLLGRFDSALGPKDANGYSTVSDGGKKMRVRNVCLPDTVDPREPKGK